MTGQTLNQMLNALQATFQRKPLDKGTVDRLRAKIDHIPDEAVPWITERLEEGNSYPRNLFLAVRDMWSRWREAHPEKCVNEQRSCPNTTKGCHNGIIVAWGFDQVSKRYVQYGFDCAACNSGSEHGMSPERLEANGFKIETLDKSYCEMNAELNGVECRTGETATRFKPVIDALKAAKRAPGQEWARDVATRTRPVEYAAGDVKF